MTKNKKSMGAANNRRRKIVLAIAFAIAIAAALALTLCGGSWLDPNARSGGYDDMSAEEVQQDLDTRVAEGEMNVSIAANITVNGTKAEPDVVADIPSGVAGTYYASSKLVP